MPTSIRAPVATAMVAGAFLSLSLAAGGDGTHRRGSKLSKYRIVKEQGWAFPAASLVEATVRGAVVSIEATGARRGLEGPPRLPQRRWRAGVNRVTRWWPCRVWHPAR